MAFVAMGVDVELKRNDATGRFDLVFDTAGPNKGNPRMTNDRVHAAMTTLFSKKRGLRPGTKDFEGGYYYDESGRRGSLLWSVILDVNSTRSQLIGCVQDAGQQLIDDKIITSYTADATKRGPGRWTVTFGWTTPSGDRKETLTL